MIPLARMDPLAMAAALPACSLYPLQGSLMLLDAHLVFRPLLAALGVSPHQVTQGSGASGALESLGSRLSLLAWVDTFRIDIVVSELPTARRDQRHKPKGDIANVVVPVDCSMRVRRHRMKLSNNLLSIRARHSLALRQ